jgi:hypothetical protein
MVLEPLRIEALRGLLCLGARGHSRPLNVRLKLRWLQASVLLRSWLIRLSLLIWRFAGAVWLGVVHGRIFLHHDAQAPQGGYSRVIRVLG